MYFKRPLFIANLMGRPGISLQGRLLSFGTSWITKSRMIFRVPRRHHCQPRRVGLRRSQCRNPCPFRDRRLLLLLLRLKRIRCVKSSKSSLPRYTSRNLFPDQCGALLPPNTPALLMLYENRKVRFLFICSLLFLKYAVLGQVSYHQHPTINSHHP